MAPFKHQFWIGAKGGLIDPKHVARLGQANWLFLYLLRGQTSVNKQGHGVFHYGHPIRIDDIAVELGKSIRTTKRWLGRLRDTGYIFLQSHGHDGVTVWIAKGKVKTRKEADRKEREYRELAHAQVPKVALEGRAKAGTQVPKVAREDLSFVLQTVEKATVAAESNPTITKVLSYYNKDTLTQDVRSLPDWIKDLKSKTAMQKQGLTQAQLDERRRKLLDQADLLRKKYPVQEKIKC